jgi:hypothetical protein
MNLEQLKQFMEPHEQSPWYIPFLGGIRRSIPPFAQGFGGLSFSHCLLRRSSFGCEGWTSTAKSRGLLRRRIKQTGWGFLATTDGCPQCLSVFQSACLGVVFNEAGCQSVFMKYSKVKLK